MKDILIRAAKTFVQAFLAAFPFSTLADISMPAIKSASLAALAAVISVIWNALLNWSRS